ncbi:phage tail protein [Sphingomonas sp. DT-207]|uniref:phage tail protein n=1 Tax=Sphingomonas sp. DT-207 TaxID=3396167 RepID=UPI003F1AA0A8
MARVDPYAQYNFIIEINDIAAGGFTEVGGLSFEQDIIEYREGADSATVRKLPGLRKYANITLKRGYTQDRALWEWRKTTLDGRTARKNGAIVLRDESGAPALRWEFAEGWLSKYEGPALNSTANEAAIEAIEIAVEDVKLV